MSVKCVQAREQTKVGYQEPKENHEVEKCQKQEPKWNQEDSNLGIINSWFTSILDKTKN